MSLPSNLLLGAKTSKKRRVRTELDRIRPNSIQTDPTYQTDQAAVVVSWP
jgi:hypothetical protein